MNDVNAVPPKGAVSDEEVERRWRDDGDMPLTSRQACDLIGMRWAPDALAQLARRDPSFPRPVVRGGGHGGHIYFRSELMQWLRSLPRTNSARFQARGLRA